MVAIGETQSPPGTSKMAEIRSAATTWGCQHKKERYLQISSSSHQELRYLIQASLLALTIPMSKPLQMVW